MFVYTIFRKIYNTVHFIKNKNMLEGRLPKNGKSTSWCCIYIIKIKFIQVITFLKRQNSHKENVDKYSIYK